MERTQSTPSTRTAGSGRTDAELAELVEKHSIRYTVAPNQVVTASREIVRHGSVVEIYGARSPDEMRLRAEDAIDVVHDVLEDVLHAVLPAGTEEVTVHVEPFIGAIYVQHQTPEIRLRVVLEPCTETDPAEGAKAEAALLETLRTRLASLGVRQGS